MKNHSLTHIAQVVDVFHYKFKEAVMISLLKIFSSLEEKKKKKKIPRVHLLIYKRFHHTAAIETTVGALEDMTILGWMVIRTDTKTD